MEYIPPKLCQFLCPKNTLFAIEGRTEKIIAHAKNVQISEYGPQDAVFMRMGFLTVTYAVYTAFICPSRHIPLDDWQPSTHCTTRTRRLAKGLPLEGTTLSDPEIRIMKSAGLDENLQPIPPRDD